MTTLNISRISKVCRACLTEKENMESLLENHNKEMFSFCTTLNVEKDDLSPHLICDHCKLELSKAYTFKQLCIKSNDILQNAISEYKLDVEILELMKSNDYFQNCSASPKDDTDDDINRSDNLENDVIESIDTNKAKKQKYPVQNLPHRCCICNEGFKIDTDLQIHMISHPEDENAVCTLCKKQFNDLKVLRRHVRIHMKCKPFQVCLETGRNYTFHEVYKRSKALARYLRHSLGLEVGDTVAIVLPNIPEFAIALLGSAEAGLRVTTVNPIYTHGEIAKQLENSESKLVFTLNSLLKTVQTAKASLQHNSKIPIVCIKHEQGDTLQPGTIDFEGTCTGDHKAPLPGKAHPDDVVLLPYSSGTTGLPKGVELTHRNLVANLCQVATPELKLSEETTATHQDIVPLFLPLFHLYGLAVVFLNMFSLGCKQITIPKFGSGMFMKLLNQYRPTITYLVPPVVLMILNNPQIELSHLECMRYIVSAAAPLGGADVERFREKTKGKVTALQVYGLTETSPIATWQTEKLENGIKIGGSGVAVPNTEFKIVNVDDPQNVGLGVKQSGELLIRGPQNMKGYYKNEEATRQTLIEDGWLRTGDIAHYDEDEHLFVTDRLKELIKVKGFQVAPAELEAIVRQHPSVADAAVIGVPHPILGEAPKAFVVFKEGTRTKENDIVEYVASKVANYKRLVGGVTVMDGLPRNPSGKLLRRLLKNM